MFSTLAFSFSSHALISEILFSVATLSRKASKEGAELHISLLTDMPCFVSNIWLISDLDEEKEYLFRVSPL